MPESKIHILEDRGDHFGFCGKDVQGSAMPKEEVRGRLNCKECFPDNFCQTCYVKFLQWYSFTKRGKEIPPGERI